MNTDVLFYSTEFRFLTQQLPDESFQSCSENGSHIEPFSLAAQEAGGSACSSLSTSFTSDRQIGPGIETEDSSIIREMWPYTQPLEIMSGHICYKDMAWL